jgi:hypothetical protein
VLVNGRRIERAALLAGDRLTIGSVVLEVGGEATGPVVGTRKRFAALLLLGIALVVTTALLARPAASAAAIPELHPETNGDTLHWKGESSAIDLILVLADPARALVELELHVPERRTALALSVNGRGSLAVDVSSKRKIALREHLQAGSNRVTLSAGPGDTLADLAVRVATTPVPDCSVAPCAINLGTALARAERLARERNAAPANLFEAWRWLRRARGFAVGIGDDVSLAKVESQLREIGSALDERCAAMQFAAARHLALDDLLAARGVARGLLDAFPGDEHGCRASGEDLLRLLDEGGK